MGRTTLSSVLHLAGQERAVLGRWPHRQLVARAIEVIRQHGGSETGRNGTPAGEVENVLFRVGRRRLRLCIEEYGSVTLWGPARMVDELAQEIAARGEP